MAFEEQLREILPEELPHRETLIHLGTLHLELIEETNRFMNLTRITEPREAAIKHVLDSVLPWRLFAGARNVLDAGTGAGFPGIPLAAILPDTRFVLAESVQKKARFVETAVQKLGMGNVDVRPVRAEDVLKSERFEIVTGRALAPLSKALPLFAPALKRGARVLLYKGPDVEEEIGAVAAEARKRGVRIAVVERYELPEKYGQRSIVELAG
ncbi:MAG TPA: 16S rRNA (guanine(527)-N(7))-methyltransferase RsmG [Bryobacteraceae bacterium]|nr:16S rRNA (guanine(527)-N(7))-methyltransferase RsmG [Bryobacteraceae bacterium]